MNDRNILLGFGETLTHAIKHKNGGDKKKHPYSFREASQHLITSTEQLLEKINTLPHEAMPNNKIVANFILHPAYIAKSYYPTKLFEEFGFNNIGSRSLRIHPRKTQLKKAPDYEMTSNIFISGSKDAFDDLLEALQSNDIEANLQQEIIKNEDLLLFEPQDKIKGNITQNKEQQFEVILHTPENEPGILESFTEFSKKIGADIDFSKLLQVSGLTFLPMTTNSIKAKEIANFTYLRVLREMPKLRIFEPLIQRSIHTMPSMSLPIEDAIDQNIKVAVFDGGIGNTHLSKWCNEKVYPGGEVTNQDLLNHGSEVTSTILFGNIQAEQTTLPIPYSKIDHYRVLDNNTPSDPDLFSVLKKILDALNSKSYHFANLSLGPRIPIEDDDVHVWTSMLDDYLSKQNTLLTVAVGNDGDLPGLNRIQPPSDMINALAIGAATNEDDTWERTHYSCIGPGRSPGLIKPDGLAFGGHATNPFLIYSPISKQVHSTAGTSFSSPLVLRNCIGIASIFDTKIDPLVIKALMIHNIKPKKSLSQDEVGRGLFPNNIQQVIYTDHNEVSVIYKGELDASQYIRVPIPFPDEQLDGKISIKATFCFTAKINPSYPDSYTNNGLVITFRPDSSPEGKSKAFFSRKEMYETEADFRKDAHKWETTLHHEGKCHANTLKQPCFDIVYQARDAGKAIKNTETEKLPYVLVVTVKAKKGFQLYNSIRQKYQTLQPIRIKQEVKIPFM